MRKFELFCEEIQFWMDWAICLSLSEDNNIQPTRELYETIQGKIKTGAEAELLFAASRQLLEQPSG